jgi:hypothetical protein
MSRISPRRGTRSGLTFNEKEIPMAITLDRVRTIFKGLEKGDGPAVFEHVGHDVDWTVMSTHPLAGNYRSEEMRHTKS